MVGPLYMAVMFYGAGMLPRLRAMTRKQLFVVLGEADRVSETVPIHMHPRPTLRVPSWSAGGLSGGQVTALLVFGLWVACAEDENVAAPLVDAWPIREGLLMCDGQGEKRVAAEPTEAAADEPDAFPLLALIDKAASVAAAEQRTE